MALGGIQLGGQRLTALRLQTELETGQRPRLPRLQAIELYPDFTRDHLQRLAAQQPQNHVPFPTRAPPLPGRQSPRPNRRGVGADPAPCTRLDRTIFPTSLDIGFSLNPCPRKLGAPQWVRLPNPTPRSFPCPVCGVNLTKEKETRYDCFWRTNGKLNSKTVATKHAATRFLTTVVAETHNGTYQQTRPLVMNAVFDEWEKHLDVKLQQGRLKPSTKKAYMSMLRKHLRPAFGTCRSDRLSEHVVLEWERRYAALLAAGTVTAKYYNNLRGTLNVVLTWARQRGQRYLTHNPLTDIKAVPVERRERRFLEPDEIARLLDATKDVRNRTIICSPTPVFGAASCSGSDGATWMSTNTNSA